MLEATAFGDTGRTKVTTYAQATPVEQGTRRWEEEAPRGALPSPRCSVGAGRAADPHER